MGMDAPKIAHRGDPAGAPVSQAPAAEHLAHMAVIVLLVELPMSITEVMQIFYMRPKSGPNAGQHAKARDSHLGWITQRARTQRIASADASSHIVMRTRIRMAFAYE